MAVDLSQIRLDVDPLGMLAMNATRGRSGILPGHILSKKIPQAEGQPVHCLAPNSPRNQALGSPGSFTPDSPNARPHRGVEHASFAVNA